MKSAGETRSFSDIVRLELKLIPRDHAKAAQTVQESRCAVRPVRTQQKRDRPKRLSNRQCEFAVISFKKE